MLLQEQVQFDIVGAGAASAATGQVQLDISGLTYLPGILLDGYRLTN